MQDNNIKRIKNKERATQHWSMIPFDSFVSAAGTEYTESKAPYTKAFVLRISI